MRDEQPADRSGTRGEIRLRVARGQGLVRGLILISAGLLCLVPAWWIWPDLNFRPSAVSNRLTDYAWAVIVVAIAVCGLAIVVAGMRWLLFAFWPGSMAIIANEEGLFFHLGNLGRRRFDWQRLEAVYRFELSVDSDEAAFLEAMDPDDERAHRLPLMRHPDSAENLNLTLTRFAREGEGVLARKLGPFIENARRSRNANP